MGKIIKRGVVDRKPGKLYYIDGKGNACEATAKRGGTKGRKSCHEPKKKAAKKKAAKKKTAKRKPAKRKGTHRPLRHVGDKAIIHRRTAIANDVGLWGEARRKFIFRHVPI